jgi:hypothetical protein
VGKIIKTRKRKEGICMTNFPFGLIALMLFQTDLFWSGTSGFRPDARPIKEIGGNRSYHHWQFL